MTRLYAILGAIGALLASIAGAFALGGRSAKNARDAKDARAEANTYRKSTEARDAVSDLSDDAVLDRLRERAGRK